MKRSAIFLLTFLLVISLTSGCSTSRQAAKTGESGKSKNKDSMVYNLGAEPQSFRPYAAKYRVIRLYTIILRRW